jgi:hypothetical protein
MIPWLSQPRLDGSFKVGSPSLLCHFKLPNGAKDSLPPVSFLFSVDSSRKDFGNKIRYLSALGRKTIIICLSAVFTIRTLVINQ